MERRIILKFLTHLHANVSTLALQTYDYLWKPLWGSNQTGGGGGAFKFLSTVCSVSQHHLAVPHQGWRGWRGNCLHWKYQPPIIQAVTFLCGSSSEEQREGEASQRCWKTPAFLQTGRFWKKIWQKKLISNFLLTSCIFSFWEGLSQSGGLCGRRSRLSPSSWRGWKMVTRRLRWRYTVIHSWFYGSSQEGGATSRRR